MYDTVLLVLDGKLSTEQASDKLGVSVRTIQRKIQIYLDEGEAGFSHKLKGRSPVNITDVKTCSEIIALYREKYADYNWSHFLEKLAEVEGIDVSYATIYTILSEAGFISPRAHKPKRKRAIHPLRARRKAFGELVQMDASKHIWFGDTYSHLHLAIDDATSKILGAYFVREETLRGYFEVFRQILTCYGVPKEFYTDRRRIFEYKRLGSGKLEKDHQTQFQLACAQFGVVRINTTSVPQAKGRVERAFGTLQDRLISEMRTADIATIEEANEFLPNFIADHNMRFALNSDHCANAFGLKPSGEELNLGLAVVSTRKVLSGNVVRFEGKDLQPWCKTGQVYLPKGFEVVVVKAYDSSLFISVGDKVWPLYDVYTKPKEVAHSEIEGRLGL